MEKYYEVCLAIKPRFKIGDPELLEKAVTNSESSYCQYITCFTRIEEFLDNLAYQLAMTPEEQCKDENGYHNFKFIEGVGAFYRGHTSGLYNNWKLEDQSVGEFGEIEVVIDDDCRPEVEWGACEIDEEDF